MLLILGELWFVHCDLGYLGYFEFMQARFRVSSMTDDEVQRNLSILRRRYSPDADDSSATMGTLSSLSGENTRLGATPHTSSLSVSPSMVDTPPSHLLARTGLTLYHLFV